ncbi:MAG: MlaD family protein [Solirubrobacteraceae bacterium]
MSTTTLTWRSMLAPILFAFVCIVLTGAAYSMFGGSLPGEAKGYHMSVDLPDATNLVEGSDVLVSGVPIGDVVGVARHEDRARVTVEVRPEFAPIRQGARVALRTKTLLGEAYLEIALGDPDAEPVADGGALDATRATPTTQFDQFVDTFTPEGRASLRDLMLGLDGAFAGRATDLSATLGRAPTTVDRLATLTARLNAQSANLEGVVSSTGEVLAALGRREGRLQAMVSRARDVFEVTGRNRRSLEVTIRRLPGLLGSLRAAGGALERATPALDRATSALVPVAARLEPALGALADAAPAYRELFAGLPSLTRRLRRGLVAVPDVVESASSAVGEYYPTSRELNPFLDLLAVNRKSPVLAFANVSSVVSGTAVGPGGVVQHYGAGIPTIWNETLAGWRKKLPTTRFNPYPKPPDALLDTGRLGVLKSYDCRHEGNVLWLPPIGAAPPCIEQGPWTFRGTSAYYPRLTLDPP